MNCVPAGSYNMSKNCGDCDYFIWPVPGYCRRPGFQDHQVDSSDRACPGFAWTAMFQTGEEKEKTVIRMVF